MAAVAVRTTRSTLAPRLCQRSCLGSALPSCKHAAHTRTPASIICARSFATRRLGRSPTAAPRRAATRARSATERDYDAVVEISGLVTKIVHHNASNNWVAFRLDTITDTDTDSRSQSLSVSGVMPNDVTLNEGTPLTLTGRYNHHEIYGDQFIFHLCHERKPQTLSATGIARYLAHSLPGIGPKMAERIVDVFGARVFHILDYDVDQLTSVKGIGKRRLPEIRTAWKKLTDASNEQREQLMFLLEHNITSAQRSLLLQRYDNEELLAVLKSDPYLCVEIQGIGFAKADDIAMKLGFPPFAPQRIRGAVLFSLLQASHAGHCYLPETELIHQTCAILNRNASGEIYSSKSDDSHASDESSVSDALSSVSTGNLLSVTAEAVKSELAAMVSTNTLVYEVLDSTQQIDKKRSTKSLHSRIVVYYITKLWSLEYTLAKRIALMLGRHAGAERQSRLQKGFMTVEAVQRWLKSYQIRQRFVFTEEQESALTAAAMGSITIITGYPGTGKTSILKALTSLWKDFGITSLLTSPTGRAASRMQESTGRPAMTCHRALGWRSFNLHFHTDTSSGTGSPKMKKNIDLLNGDILGAFEYHEGNPFVADSFIIDELSMIDLPLMTAMMSAVPLSAQVVLVGDPDQLPAVGVGNVLHDLIDSGEINVVRLTQPIRQAENSILNKNARAVNSGNLPKLMSLSHADGDSEAMFLPRDDDPAVSMTQIFADYLPNCAPTIDPLNDVQLLTPMRRGSYGVRSLNPIIQSLLNPPSEMKREIERFGGVLRVGDRVMQRKNNNARGVYNGEIGVIIDIGPVSDTDGDSVTGAGSGGEAVTVRFDPKLNVSDQVYRVDSADWTEIELAWAMTVHKSQGSEYRMCVLVCSKQHTLMLHRSLIYTAITRAKDRLIVVGDLEALAGGVKRALTHKRYTGLRARLQTHCERMAHTQPIDANDERTIHEARQALRVSAPIIRQTEFREPRPPVNHSSRARPQQPKKVLLRS